MKLESELYDRFDHIAEGIRHVANPRLEQCCQFHVQSAQYPKLLPSDMPKLCGRCRRKLMGLREYLSDFEGKYLVIEQYGQPQ